MFHNTRLFNNDGGYRYILMICFTTGLHILYFPHNIHALSETEALERIRTMVGAMESAVEETNVLTVVKESK